MLSLNHRSDSWQNFFTGLGSAKDKATHTLSASASLPVEYLEQLYTNDDIAARICDLLPSEMLRQGISIKVNEGNFSRPDLAAVCARL